MIRTYRVTLTGKTPLLMHNDNIEWADQMERWKADPKNTATGKAGDDRSPAHRWLGCLYHDDARFVVPSDNFMRALMEGGSLVPTGKGKKTYKAQTQSGTLPGQLFWPLLVEGEEIPTAPFFALMEKGAGFDAYQALAAEHRFMLYVKRARVGNAKHVRVRPRFDRWSVTGLLTVTDDQIKQETLQTILDNAGEFKGLGDWRPSAPKSPGPHGTFTAGVEEA